MQQKVLIVGPKFYGYSLSVEKAFKKLGFSTVVMTFSEKDVENSAEKIAYHLTRDKPGFFEKKRIRFNIRFRKIYDNFQPDIVFIIKGSTLYPESITHAKNSINILWMMDSIYRNDYSYNLRKLVDHLFLFEETDVEKLREEEGIVSHFLPLALDESVYYPVQNEKDIDVLFVGMLYGNRIRLIDQVIKNFPGKKIKVYGKFFSPLREPLKYLFRKNRHIYINKNIEPELLNKLYSRTKVCLNIHHDQSVVGVNQRFFEILGSRSLEITDYKPYMGKHFTTGDLFWYRTEEEMLSQIGEALDNYQQLGTVIKNGYQKVIAAHTFTERMRYVLDVIGYKK